MISRWMQTGLISGALLLTACGGGNFDLEDLIKPRTDDPNNPNNPNGVTQIRGEVRDPDGRAVADATVTLRRRSPALTTTTNAEGRFILSPTDGGFQPAVLVQKTGFAANAKEVPVKAGLSTSVTIRLFPDQLSSSFAASAGTSIAPGGATVVVPANAVQTASGATYAGTVQVSASYFPPDTLAGVQAFPTAYFTLSPGARDVEQPLINLGRIEMKLRDAAGQTLTLRPGVAVRMTFPATASGTGSSPVTLSYYDETNLGWLADRPATRQADGSVVADFQNPSSTFSPTAWIANLGTARASISGCFRTAAGQPVSDVGLVGLRGTGWESRPVGVSADGTFNVFPAAADVPLELYSLEQPPAFTRLAISATAPSTSAGTRQLPCITTTSRAAGTAWTLPLASTLFSPP